ncbi:MAG: hypothetical protein KBS83_02950 [Lachnospiraceae bacterium]|nr:hypothetical protein [Candidatus Equihabitans merdae]
MKVAFLVLCHKNPNQINQLIQALSHPDVDIFIHLDKKCGDMEGISKDSGHVYMLPDEKRVDARWATYSLVEASLNLLEAALAQDHYDFFWLISGQDYPLRKAEEILRYLEEHPEDNFVNLYPSKNSGAGKSNNYDKRNDILFSDWLVQRGLLNRIICRAWVELTGGYNHTFSVFKRKNPHNVKYYFGSEWWCINHKAAAYMAKYVAENPWYAAFYKKTSCSDESFFQTLLMNSPYVSTRKEYLHYIDWSEGNNSPKTLTCADLDAMFESGKLMARKIDTDVDRDIIATINRWYKD